MLAIASGKKGTGKTTVATNLAWVADAAGCGVACLDCNLEEPNGHIFLKPAIAAHRPIQRLILEVDVGRCAHCGQCGQISQYNAIVCIAKQKLVYPELCHSCGGCALVRPTGAIHDVPRPIGLLMIGTSGRCPGRRESRFGYRGRDRRIGNRRHPSRRCGR